LLKKIPYPMLVKQEASLVVKKKVSTLTKLKKVLGIKASLMSLMIIV